MSESIDVHRLAIVIISMNFERTVGRAVKIWTLGIGEQGVVILNAKPLKTETWAEIGYGLENDSENKERLKEYDWERW